MYAGITKPWLYEIAEGRINNCRPFTKLGYNESIDTTAEDLWEKGGLYAFPTTAQQMKISSDSANDTAAGTGVQKVKIYYLDNELNEKTEIITLNGLTAVNTVAIDIYRVNHLIAESVGSNNGAVGNVSLTNIAGTITYGYLPSGRTINRNIAYTVPKGHTLNLCNFLLSVSASTNGRSARVVFEATYNHIEQKKINFMTPQFATVLQDQLYDMPLEIPIVLPEGCDINCYAQATGGAVAVAMTIRGWLERLIPNV